MNIQIKIRRRVALTSLRRIGFLLSSLALTGCANFSADGGLGPVAQRIAEDASVETVKLTSEQDAEVVAKRVASLLSEPLTAEAAIQIALINNRGLQAKFNALGLSEVEFVEAGLPENPTFSFQRMSGEGSIEFERKIAGNLLGLFILPTRRSIAGSHFKAAQYLTLDATLRLAGETRRTYYRAVASEMRVAYLDQARIAAEAMADLARRLGQTGAKNKLDQARAAGFHAEITTRLSAAKFAARRERESLTRALGLWGTEANLKLTADLPPLPGSIDEIEDIEARAITRRSDLLAARLELEATERALGLAQATRFVSMLELAGIDKSDRNGNGEVKGTRGFELAFQIPIFDLGEISQRRSREVYMRAFNELVEKAINVRSETRTAYYGYRTAYDIARTYEEKILPARKVVNDESVLRYNGMLIDVFELLTTAHEGIASTIAAIDARRDFFIAESEFKSALTGGATDGDGNLNVSVLSSPSSKE